MSYYKSDKLASASRLVFSGPDAAGMRAPFRSHIYYAQVFNKFSGFLSSHCLPALTIWPSFIFKSSILLVSFYQHHKIFGNIDGSKILRAQVDLPSAFDVQLNSFWYLSKCLIVLDVQVDLSIVLTVEIYIVSNTWHRAAIASCDLCTVLYTYVDALFLRLSLTDHRYIQY